MRVSDLIRVNDEGEIVEGDRPVDASATSIHAPIYKARGRGQGQDGGSENGVEAIVHVHGPHSKGECARETALRPAHAHRPWPLQPSPRSADSSTG
jgi:ribulose-5-phosphate 4-epimerase/fuculose-1-phosphate aldolase